MHDASLKQVSDSLSLHIPAHKDVNIYPEDYAYQERKDPLFSFYHENLVKQKIVFYFFVILLCYYDASNGLIRRFLIVNFKD